MRVLSHVALFLAYVVWFLYNIFSKYLANHVAICCASFCRTCMTGFLQYMKSNVLFWWYVRTFIWALISNGEADGEADNVTPSSMVVISKAFSCLGNLSALQVFGGMIRSCLPQEAHNPSTQFTQQHYNTAHWTYLFVIQTAYVYVF